MNACWEASDSIAPDYPEPDHHGRGEFPPSGHPHDRTPLTVLTPRLGFVEQRAGGFQTAGDTSELRHEPRPARPVFLGAGCCQS